MRLISRRESSGHSGGIETDAARRESCASLDASDGGPLRDASLSSLSRPESLLGRRARGAVPGISIALELAEAVVHVLDHPPHPALHGEARHVLVHVLLLEVAQDALRGGQAAVRPGNRAHAPRRKVRVHALQPGRLRRVFVLAPLGDGPVRLAVAPSASRKHVVAVGDDRQRALPKHNLRAAPVVALQNAVAEQQPVPARARVVAPEKVNHLLHGGVVENRSAQVFCASVRQHVPPRAIRHAVAFFVHHLCPRAVALERGQTIRHAIHSFLELEVIRHLHDP
mmetsp:Transcript_11083/g.46580  ORF Transcript_11083/g.46580 Transcript_11083/m.46580 type:complete len:283 (+) Transcript_11083:791-1639(+)